MVESNDQNQKLNSMFSNAPLDITGQNAPQVPKVQPQKPQQVVQKAVQQAVQQERITGIKTFFTKLHSGALEYQDEIIAEWLKKNPQVTIKYINVVVGDIQAKKTEPNIVITVWY